MTVFPTHSRTIPTLLCGGGGEGGGGAIMQFCALIFSIAPAFCSNAIYFSILVLFLPDVRSLPFSPPYYIDMLSVANVVKTYRELKVMRQKESVYLTVGLW